MVTFIVSLIVSLFPAGDPILTCYAYEDDSWGCYHAGDKPAPTFEGYPLNSAHPAFIGPQSHVGPAHATWEAEFSPVTNHG